MTRPPSSSRALMWAGFVGIFIWGSIAGLLGALLPQLRERASITLSESSWMFVALSSGLVLSSLVAGYLLDRFGKKVVLCTAVAAVVAALVLFEIFTSLGPMVLLAFVLGAGGSATVTGGHALIADLNPEHRAASLNLLDVFFGIGAFVTPFAIVPLQARGGTAAVLFTLAGLAGAGLAFLLMVRFPASEGGHAVAAATPLSIATSPLFLVPALLVFLYVGTEQSVWDWQVTYFMRRLSMDNIAAARVLSIFPIAIMLGRLVNNRLLMRISPMPVLLVSTIGATLCFVLAWTATSTTIAAGALLLAGLLMASIFPTTLGVVSSRFSDASGTALGFAITCGWLGSMAISPTFGFIAQRTDFARGYLVIVGSAAAMALTAAVLARQSARSAQAGAPVAAPGARLVQDR